MKLVEYEGKRYYNASQAAKFIGSTRDQFVRNLAPKLKAHHIGAAVHDLYLEEDLLPYKGVRPATSDPLEKK